MRKNVMIVLSLLCVFSGPVRAQLNLTQTSQWVEIDFDQTVSGVNVAAFSVAAGLPLLAGPAMAGQLEASAWDIVADGANAYSPAAFNNSVTAGFSSLTSAGTASYGWGAWNLGNNHALALLPSTALGTPGSITLKVMNNTGFSLNTLALSYRVGAYNDKDRANSVAFYYSADNITFLSAALPPYVSPGTATQSWDSVAQSLSLSGLDWAEGNFFYLRWFFQDESGTGLRDEFLLDDIRVMGSSVMPQATYLAFTNFTDTVAVGEIIPEFSVEARRPDHSPDSNYHGLITLQKFSGPGDIHGSLSHTCQDGLVSFDDVYLDQPGHYMLQAVGDSLAPVLVGVIVVVPATAMEEIVVPRYFGGKSAAAANNCRTPFAVCLRFAGQPPLTTFKLQAGLALSDEPASSYGAGNIWNGMVFSTSAIPVGSYFTTDSAGDSGPVWVFLQPTGNSTRFEAGTQHQLRVSICPNGGSMPSQPMFSGTSLLTALDIAMTPRTADSMDDGAFVAGTTNSALGGKFILLFDNAAGEGRPVFCTQVRTASFTSTAQSELPAAVDSVWRQIPVGQDGQFVAVFPSTGSTGIRRIEIRNADNVLQSFQRDGDGIWPQGANSTNAARRQLLRLTEAEIPLVNVIRGMIRYYNAAQSPLDSSQVMLSDAGGNIIQSVTTDSGGNYQLIGIPNGTYTLSVSCGKRWGGGNATDAQSILHHFVKISPLHGIFLAAAQVSQPAGKVVNSVDALFVLRRFAGLISTFPPGDWIFETALVTVDGSGIVTKDLRGICRGDVNGDFNP